MANPVLKIILSLEDKATSKLKGISRTLTRTFQTLAIAAVTAASISIKKFADMGQEIGKLAKQTGMSTEAISKLKYAADQSETSLSAIGTAIQGLARNLKDASEGGKVSIKLFNDLGLSVEELLALSPEDRFTKVASAINNISDPTLKSAVAMDAFGRSASDLLPMLQDMPELMQQAKLHARIFSAEDVAQAEAFAKMIKDNQLAIENFTDSVAKKAIPIITELVGRMRRFLVTEDERNRLANLNVKASEEYIKMLGGEENSFKETAEEALRFSDALGTLWTEEQNMADSLRLWLKPLQDAEEAQRKLTAAHVADQAAVKKLQEAEHKRFIEARKQQAEMAQESAFGEADWYTRELLKQAEEKGIPADTMAGIMAQINQGPQGLLNARQMLAQFLSGGAGAMTTGKNDQTAAQRAIEEVVEQKDFGPRNETLTDFAEGGIVNKPTIARIGEAGPEAVIPLSQNTLPIENVTNITLLLDGEVIAKVVNRRLGQEYNRRQRLGG